MHLVLTLSKAEYKPGHASFRLLGILKETPVRSLISSNFVGTRLIQLIELGFNSKNIAVFNQNITII
jgi:hypothetical protein